MKNTTKEFLSIGTKYLQFTLIKYFGRNELGVGERENTIGKVSEAKC